MLAQAGGLTLMHCRQNRCCGIDASKDIGDRDTGTLGRTIRLSCDGHQA